MMLKYCLLFSLLSNLIAPIYAQVNLQNSNLPILVITTENNAPIYDEPKTKAHLGIVWNGDDQENNIAGPFNNYDGDIAIELRGSSSQLFDKKGYGFETRKPDGENLNVPLLGFPKENDWVLHGPYSDKSLIRNALGYILAGQTMAYAPRVKLCEVVINGDYKGVYLFTEKIKRDANRVDISNLDEDDNTGDGLTGGYILKIDKSTGSNIGGFVSEYPPFAGSFSQTFFQYDSPENDEITQAQRDYISQYINGLEDVLMSPQYADTTLGYRKYFDVEAFIRYFFIQEVSRNVDGYRLSTYMYKDKDSEGGKLKMGPIWDLNLGFGNVDYCIGGGTDGWAYNFNNFCPNDGWVVHFWWKRLLQDIGFVKQLQKDWVALRQSTYSDEHVLHIIDSLESLLQVPAQRNFERWDILGQYVWPNAYVGQSHSAEVDYLKNWTIARLQWMDGAMVQLSSNTPTKGPFLLKTYPNPYSETLTFDFDSTVWEYVKIEIFNAQGQHIETLEKRATEDPTGKVFWDTVLPAGVYFYRFWLGREVAEVGKVVRF